MLGILLYISPIKINAINIIANNHGIEKYFAR